MKKIFLFSSALLAVFFTAAQTVAVEAPATADTAFKVYNAGNGPVGSFVTKNADNTGALIYGDHFGKGGGIRMRLMNAQNNNPGIYMLQTGNGDGVYVASNKSKAATFYCNAGNTDTAVTVKHDGTGQGMVLLLNNATNNSDALSINTKGLGKGITLELSNAAGTADALDIKHFGDGRGINVEMLNTTTYEKAFRIIHKGLGTAMYCESQGSVGVHGVAMQSNGSGLLGDNMAGGNAIVGRANCPAGLGTIAGINDSSGAAIKGVNRRNGIGVLGLAGENNSNAVAGRFENVNSASTSNVLEVASNSAANLVVMKKNNLNVARINDAGKGFFNGGTQASGADMAEAFDVAGDIINYEPGDVLIIDIDTDRTVVKSNTAYSTLVAGVYATKPGMLMTEENIDTDISDKVPMGVVGVIPTKVCAEGGAIKRGDFIVTSSVPGVAMKGDTRKIKPGQIIGKALENFSGEAIGKIKVLVNVK